MCVCSDPCVFVCVCSFVVCCLLLARVRAQASWKTASDLKLPPRVLARRFLLASHSATPHSTCPSLFSSCLPPYPFCSSRFFWRAQLEAYARQPHQGRHGSAFQVGGDTNQSNHSMQSGGDELDLIEAESLIQHLIQAHPSPKHIHQLSSSVRFWHVGAAATCGARPPLARMRADSVLPASSLAGLTVGACLCGVATAGGGGFGAAAAARGHPPAARDTSRLLPRLPPGHHALPPPPRGLADPLAAAPSVSAHVASPLAAPDAAPACCSGLLARRQR